VTSLGTGGNLTEARKPASESSPSSTCGSRGRRGRAAAAAAGPLQPPGPRPGPGSGRRLAASATVMHGHARLPRSQPGKS
jgi:hypothetical protein